MHLSPAQLLRKYLEERDINPEQFSKISGMPQTEVTGIIDGDLPITILRAHHLAAAFDTKPEIWLNGKQSQEKTDCLV